MNAERAVFVYTTYPSVVEAEKAGRALVERRLCACVNILPGMISHYWWNGAVERGEEVVMIIKIRASHGIPSGLPESHTQSISICTNRASPNSTALMTNSFRRRSTP
jgi:uncharacterized protein involved in tolerance to divalent cations